MSYLLDASALLLLITTHGRSLIIEAAGHDLLITDLTVYESCKRARSKLLRTISSEDAENVAGAIENAITSEVIKVANCERLGLSKTLELAQEEGITFLDASYVESTIAFGAILVTEDEKLRSMASKYIKAIAYAELERELAVRTST